MKIRFLAILLFPLLAYALELAPNGNFEQMAGRWVRSWNPARGWKGRTDYRCSKGVLCIERLTADGSGAYLSTPIPVIEGTEYTVSTSWKAAIEKGSADLGVYWLDAKGKNLKYSLIKRFTKTFDTTTSSGKVKAPAGSVNARMLLVFSGVGNVEFYTAGFSTGETAAAVETKPDMTGNIAPNADFKLRKGKYPASWEPAWGWKGKSEYGIDSEGYPFIKRAANDGSGAYRAVFPVKAGIFYTVSGEIKIETANGSADIALQFFDAKGKVVQYQLIGRVNKTTGWKKFQKLVHVPPTAVKVHFLLVASGEVKASFRYPFFGTNIPDAADNRTGVNLLLNPSFEEADFQDHFTDTWQLIAGKARRTAGISHGFHALELDPGSQLRYGWDAPAISVQGIPFLYRRINSAGTGKLQFELTFFDAARKKISTDTATVVPDGKNVKLLDDKVNIPPQAVTASLILRNSGSAPVTVDALYLGMEPFSKEKLGRVIPVEKEVTCNTELTMPVSSVKEFQGTPTWFIDGKPVVNSIFTTSFAPGMRKDWHEYGKKVLKHGKFPILVVGASITPENYGERHTLATALAKTDFTIRAALAEIPDAKFVIWLFMEPSFAFAAKYPDEIIKLEDPTLKWVSPEPPYSYSSEIWGRQCERRIKEYLYALRSQPYADRIVGISPGLGKYAENNHAHANTAGGYSLGGFNLSEVNFFRQWLFQEYKGDITALANAWGKNGHFNFTNAQVPTSLQRIPKFMGAFYDPAKQRQAIDYSRCGSFAILHRVLKLCRSAKEATDGRIFTFAQFAYFTGSMGHRELPLALKSPYLDALGPAPPYINRGAGDDIPDHGPAASVREHGKVWLCQADVRSHLASDHNWMYGRTANEAESIGVYLREMGHYMTSAIIPYHMTFERWYDSPALLKLVSKFDKWMALSGHFERRSKAEVAIVYDPVSLAAGNEISIVRRIMPPQQSTLEYNRTFEWHHLGTPYDFFVLDDLLKSRNLDQYKAVIMAANYALTPEQRHLIKTRLQKNGRTIVWFYAPGYFLHDGTKLTCSAANTAVTGFKLAVDDKLHDLAIKLDNGDIYGKFTTDIYGGFTTPKRPIKVRPETFRPRFRVVPEKGVEIFGYFADDNKPAAAIRRFKDHTSVYWGSTALNKEVLRPILEKAGVHFYTSLPAVVYANNNFLTIHTPAAGKKEIILPRKTEIIYDLYADKEIAVYSDKVTVDMAKNSSVLLYFGSRSELKKARAEVEKKSFERARKNSAEKKNHVFIMPAKKAKAKKADPSILYDVDAMGFIRHWNFLGPFPNYEKENAFNKDFLNGEAGIINAENKIFTALFDATDTNRALERTLWFNGKADKKELKLQWRPVEFSVGMIKPVFEELTDLKYIDRMAYYIFCKVISDREREVVFSIGSDDGNKSWVNSVLCTAVNPVSRSLKADSEQFRLKLKKGENTVLVKICQGQGNTGHAVRFLDPESGKPVTDLKISLK